MASTSIRSMTALQVDPRDDAVDVDPVDRLLQVGPRHDGVDVHPVDDRLDVGAGDDRVDIDPVDDPLQVDPRDDPVDVDPVDRLLQVGPRHDGIDVEARGERVEVDVPPHQLVDVDEVEQRVDEAGGDAAREGRGQAQGLAPLTIPALDEAVDPRLGPADPRHRARHRREGSHRRADDRQLTGPAGRVDHHDGEADQGVHRVDPGPPRTAPGRARGRRRRRGSRIRRSEVHGAS